MRTRSKTIFGVGALLALVGTAPAGGSNPGHEAARGEAAPSQERRVVVSLDKKHLWLIAGRDTIFDAPVAVGRGHTFQFADRTYGPFETPRGWRRVIAKEEDPLWVAPDWHYLQKAEARKLEPVFLEKGDIIELKDGSHIEVRGDQVGRTNSFGNWWPFSQGAEIIFDGKIFVPPLASAQRRVPLALGPYKIDLGGGYLIHGVHHFNEDSIGTRASHGCIRMRNVDVKILYGLVEVGTSVQII